MKPILYTRRVILTAFILSLLFHASSVLYIVVQRTQQQDSPLLDEQTEQPLKQKIKQENEWAETKARAGNFGAPVMFQDEPEEIVNSSDTAEKEIEDKDDPEQTQQEEQKIIEDIIPEKITPLEKNVSLQELPQQKIPTPTKPSQKKRAPQAPKINPTPNPTRSLAKPTINGPKPPLSLAQLTQGFLNHVKNEGNHAIHMLGKKGGAPTDEQIKYERYLEKLSWCLQNSFNINNHKFPIASTAESVVYVLLALNQDGTMKHCNITKTSGDPQLDRLTLFIFNDASTSFPPVPHYLPHDPFTITYIITHNTTEQNGTRLYRR